MYGNCCQQEIGRCKGGSGNEVQDIEIDLYVYMYSRIRERRVRARMLPLMTGVPLFSALLYTNRGIPRTGERLDPGSNTAVLIGSTCCHQSTPRTTSPSRSQRASPSPRLRPAADVVSETGGSTSAMTVSGECSRSRECSTTGSSSGQRSSSAGATSAARRRRSTARERRRRISARAATRGWCGSGTAGRGCGEGGVADPEPGLSPRRWTSSPRTP